MLKGSSIRIFRLRKKFSQDDLADRLGITQQYLSAIENSKIVCPQNVEDKFFQVYERFFNRADKDLFKERYPYNGIKLLGDSNANAKFSNESSNEIYGKTNNFILNNDVDLIMKQIIDMKLEKYDIKLLFDEMLEHAKILKKERS